MEMQIGNLFALMKYRLPDDVFEEKLFAAPQLAGGLSDAPPPEAEKKKRKKAAVPVDVHAAQAQQKRKKRRKAISLSVVLALLIALLVLGIVGWSTGLIPRIVNRYRQTELSAPPAEQEEIVWHDAALEKAARAWTGTETGPIAVSDLSGITVLHFRGTACSFDLGALPETGQTSELRDLSDLLFFPNLSCLVLEDQALSGLETLPPCGIETLILNGCALTDLQGIGRLTHLRDLNVTDCPLRGLGDLDLCLDLRQFSLIGCHVSDFSPVKPLTRLASVSFSGCHLEELTVVFGLSSLTDVALYDCDLRGRFFYDFDTEWRLVSLRLSDCKLNSTRNLGDFQGLTTITLIRTGETLDWTELASLPVLKTVYADASMESMLRAVLAGTDVVLEPVEG